MEVFLNGLLVPLAEAFIPAFDRGFLYGDGLFETLRVVNGVPLRWGAHLERLQRGAEFIKLRLPFPPDELRHATDELIARNAMPDALLRLNFSRGAGPRGYLFDPAPAPTTLLSLHPAPAEEGAALPPLRLITATLQVAARNPLAAFKTCGKLPQILARVEAHERGAQEAILCNTDGDIAEASSANVFWIDGDTVVTPPVESSALDGVTRAVVRELCADLGIATRQSTMPPARLLAVAGVFLTNSVLGPVEAGELDGHPLARSPLTRRLQEAYSALVRQECPARSAGT